MCGYQSIYTYVRVCVCISCVQLFLIPWTVAQQASVNGNSLGQNAGSGLLCSPPRDLPNKGWTQGLPPCRGILYCLSHQEYWSG